MKSIGLIVLIFSTAAQAQPYYAPPPPPGATMPMTPAPYYQRRVPDYYQDYQEYRDNPNVGRPRDHFLCTVPQSTPYGTRYVTVPCQ